MLAYAPHSHRRASPRTLMLVVGGHLTVLALVLTARSEFVEQRGFDPTRVIFVEPEAPPPPSPPEAPPRDMARDTPSRIDTPAVIIPTPATDLGPIDRGPPLTDANPLPGKAADPLPGPAKALPVRKAAVFATPADALRPPYPEAKRRLEEEASLRLALQIDPRGRVVSVDPVGFADPIFLDAARKHIVKRWRYKPASEDGVAVGSRIVVTLKFELE